MFGVFLWGLRRTSEFPTDIKPHPRDLRIKQTEFMFVFYFTFRRAYIFFVSHHIKSQWNASKFVRLKHGNKGQISKVASPCLFQGRRSRFVLTSLRKARGSRRHLHPDVLRDSSSSPPPHTLSLNLFLFSQPSHSSIHSVLIFFPPPHSSSSFHFFPLLSNLICSQFADAV